MSMGPWLWRYLARGNEAQPELRTLRVLAYPVLQSRASPTTSARTPAPATEASSAYVEVRLRRNMEPPTSKASSRARAAVPAQHRPRPRRPTVIFKLKSPPSRDRAALLGSRTPSRGRDACAGEGSEGREWFFARWEEGANAGTRCGSSLDDTRSRRWGCGGLRGGDPGCVTARSLALAHLAGFAHTTRVSPVLENENPRSRLGPDVFRLAYTTRALVIVNTTHLLKRLVMSDKCVSAAQPVILADAAAQEGPPRCSRALPRADLALEDPRRALRGPQGETTSPLACAPPPARNRIRPRVQQRRARSTRPFHQMHTAAIQQLPVVDMMLAGPLEVTVARACLLAGGSRAS
ncbi:hypothetical protein DFH09DRAFT_1281750 [Mycena vulgaris]|nr:hypothetical protein DFH09DRAFT_1281750 [Mycena vulgaris]